MGCGASLETNKQVKQNAIIEKKLEKDFKESREVIKLLLLGTGECGKSTILKQMKILHDNGFTELEIAQQREVVYSNCVTFMVTMLKAVDSLDIQLKYNELNDEAIIVCDALENGHLGEPLSEELHQALQVLWDAPGLKEAYERRSEYQLPDCASYFLDNLSRIAQTDYVPTEQDVLYSRARTTGIVEVKFTIRAMEGTDQEFRVYDVGGQRSERRKWIHCFDDVNALIFLVAISEYDQVLMEDLSTNRLEEAITLFSSVCNSSWFTNTSMILFLNKKDLFEQKIKQGILINGVFPNYKGNHTYEETSSYIMQHFKEQNMSKENQVYSHLTCATDTGQVKFVLDSVISMIINQNISNLGL